MKAKVILALVFFLTIQAAAQDVSRPQTYAQCKFSDGKKITVTYSPVLKNYRLATDESLVTVKGISVPAGDYDVFPVWDSHSHWNLRMTNQTGNGQSSELPPMPMSATASALPVGNFRISFDQTGGSCMLHLGAEKSNALLSLEFTEKNADLPVLE